MFDGPPFRPVLVWWLSVDGGAVNRGRSVARKLKSDRVLFTATFLLVCVSVVMVFSASALVALERFDQPDLFLIKQALWAVLGLAVLAIVMRIDYRTYRNDLVITGLLAFVGLLLVAVLFSPAVNGSRRWFGLGGLGIQPSELAKVACVLFTALMLERRMHRINEVAYSLLGIALVCGLAVGLILLQPDMGTAALARLHRRRDGVLRRPVLHLHLDRLRDRRCRSSSS